MINAFNKGICVELTITQPWGSYFQIAGKYSNSFKTNPLNIIFDDFSSVYDY